MAPDSLAIDVTEPEPPVTVLAEDWRGGLGNAWVTYETPRPTIAFGPDSIPGVLTNGDGHYASGVYSTRAFPVSAGLGIEVLISTPFTGEPEQVLHVALGGWLDDSTLAAWDHTTWLPGRKTLDRNSKCNVLVAKQSDTGGTSPAVTLRLSSGLYQAETRVAAGSDEWYRLRLQVFSDGTCGLAVNGRSLIRSRHRMRLDRPYRVFLEGSTVGTRLIAGPLEVWQGVRGDVDWEESAGR